MTEERLSHVDGTGRLQMVDVSSKDATVRTASARCVVLTQVATGSIPARADGLDAVQAARLAGIQAAKATSTLIPLCHPLGLDDVQVDVVAIGRGLEVRSSVTTVGRTGVEMEALTACAVCAVSLLASVATLDADARVAELAVAAKTGGKSDWVDAATPRR